MACRSILLTCVLLGTWEFAGTVLAPQFGSAVNEALNVVLCQDQGGPPRYEGGEPVPPSVGVRVERTLQLGDRKLTSMPEFFCFVRGERQTYTYNCPDIGTDAGGDH
jgi:hypothetical protein